MAKHRTTSGTDDHGRDDTHPAPPPDGGDS